MLELQEKLRAFLNSTLWEDSKRIVEQNPEMLEKESDYLMAVFSSWQGDDEGKRSYVEEHRALLARCREVGVDQAFAGKTPTGQVMGDKTVDGSFCLVGGWMIPSKHGGVLIIPAAFDSMILEAKQLETQAATDFEANQRLIDVYTNLLVRTGIGNELIFERCALLDAIADAYLRWQSKGGTQYAYHAIDYLKKTIIYRNPIIVPIDYAITQTRIGRVYAQLSTDNNEENLEQAISHFRDALQFHRQSINCCEYSRTNYELGMAYSKLRKDNWQENLKQAIAFFQEALRYWTFETTPSEYAETREHLAYAYVSLSAGDLGKNLTRAIDCYQEALRVWTPETAPLDHGRCQMSLAAVLLILPVGDRRNNLLEAEKCLKEALLFLKPETSPYGFAKSRHILGDIYAELPTEDRSENLKQAIECYQEALRFWTPESNGLRILQPVDYAKIQNSLGLAYADLPTGDRGENLAQAMRCYRAALEVFSSESSRLEYEYASTQTNLGDAYVQLQTLKGNQAGNLKQAIECYQEALRFRKPETAPLEYATTLTSLGLAYAELPTGDRGENLGRAIECYQEALRYRKPKTAPFDYAKTQNNIGGAYLKRAILGKDREADLARAVKCYKIANRYFKAKIVPKEYAICQTNLGTAYSTGYFDALVGSGHRRAELVPAMEGYKARAIRCYRKALHYYTPETAPRECRQTTIDLARLYFEQGDWNAAVAVYRTAIDAGERLYRAGLSTESKASEMVHNSILYRHAAYATARLGRTAEALVTLERGKTRLLAEALRLRISRPSHVPGDVWAAFEQAGATVRAVQARDAVMVGEQSDPVQAYATRVQDALKASAGLDSAIEQVRAYAPDFLRQFDLPDIQALISDEHMAIIAFCITDQGSMGFVLSHNESQAVQMVDVPGFTQKSLNTILFGTDGWLAGYDNQDITRWRLTLEQVLMRICEELLTPILTALPTGVEKLVLLPLGGLFLLPLHAAPLAGYGSDRLCDRYQVSFAPSAEVLANSRAKAERAIGSALHAVINPESDSWLAFAAAEGTAIAEQFATHQYLEGWSGTKAAVVAGVRGKAYLHFACHAHYNWDAPLESGLTLADGRLTLAELQSGSVDLSTSRLATLSACETGIVDVIKGSSEEYVGLPAGFMLAGVPCVVSSLWSVPDISTALVMERFYRNHLTGGMDFVAALHEAQHWVRQLGAREVAEYAETCYRQSKEIDKSIQLFSYWRHYDYEAKAKPTDHPFAHPYYWAAFTVNGM